MEKVNISDTVTDIKNDVVKEKKKIKFGPFKFFLILLSLLILSTALYFAYTYYVKYTKEISDLNSELNTTKEELSSTKELLNTTNSDLENKSKIVDIRTVVPSGARTFTYLSKCGVGISVPDETQEYEPFDSIGRKWRIEYRKIAAGSTFKNSPFIGGSQYTSYLRNDVDASGYNPGMVSVMCIKNSQNETIDTFAKKYLDLVKAESTKIAKDLSEPYNANSSVKDLGEKEAWGVKTRSVSITAFSVADSVRETGNIFLSGGNLYYVYYSSGSTNTKTIDSMKSIFNSLVVFNK